GRDILPTTVIGPVTVAPTMPALAQLRTGDTIRAVDGKPVASWNDVRQSIVTGHGPVAIQTQRSTVTVPATTDSARIAVYGSIGYYISPVIDSIVSGDRAAAGGLQRGDSIVAIAGSPVR